jgi:hypothetical protein
MTLQVGPKDKSLSALKARKEIAKELIFSSTILTIPRTFIRENLMQSSFQDY